MVAAAKVVVLTVGDQAAALQLGKSTATALADLRTAYPKVGHVIQCSLLKCVAV